MEDTVTRLVELSGEELQRLLDVVRGSDSVELKLTLPEDGRAKAAAALGIDPLLAQVRQVFFFDTPELALNQAGLVVRARRRQNEKGDTVIKVRPVELADLTEELRASPDFGVEVDAMPGGYVCSASFKGSADNEKIRDAVVGHRKVEKLFSKQQRAFYEAHAPAGFALSDLLVLGPIPTLRVKFRSEGFARPMVAELWNYPDGSRVVELSTKAKPSEAFQAGLEWRAFLETHDVDITGEQQTKTKTALEFFTMTP